MASSIPAARAHLKSVVEVALDVPVVYGDQILKSPEYVRLMGVVNEESDRALGNQGAYRDEEYTVRLVLRVFKGGTSQGVASATAEKVEARAWELVEDIRSAVHTNRSPSVLPSGWWGVTATSSEGTVLAAEDGKPAGWLCDIDIDVFCRARVTSG